MKRLIKISMLVFVIASLAGCGSDTAGGFGYALGNVKGEISSDSDHMYEDTDAWDEDAELWDELENELENDDYPAEETLTEDELKEKLKEQPLQIVDTDYLVQDEKDKETYPDMLQVVFENNSGEKVDNATIAYAAWDKDGEPVEITDSMGDSEYFYMANADGIDLSDGETFGEDMGVHLAEDNDIDQFKAIIVSCETADGEEYNNEYLDDFIELYVQKSR